MLFQLSYSRARAPSSKAAISMTVRANDIALRDLFEQVLDRDASGHLRHEAGLLRAIAMIKFHRTDWPCAAAVGAGQSAKADQ